MTSTHYAREFGSPPICGPHTGATFAQVTTKIEDVTCPFCLVEAQPGSNEFTTFELNSASSLPDDVKAFFTPMLPPGARLVKAFIVGGGAMKLALQFALRGRIFEIRFQYAGIDEIAAEIRRP
jgi:hypothetical protein